MCARLTSWNWVWLYMYFWLADKEAQVLLSQSVSIAFMQNQSECEQLFFSSHLFSSLDNLNSFDPSLSWFPLKGWAVRSQPYSLYFCPYNCWNQGGLYSIHTCRRTDICPLSLKKIMMFNWTGGDDGLQYKGIARTGLPGQQKDLTILMPFSLAYKFPYPPP